jgi:hypothetical protein
MKPTLTADRPTHLLYELTEQAFYLNSTFFFLAVALADGAFKTYKRWEDIISIKKPHNNTHVLLHYENFVLERPILRSCKLTGPTNQLQSTPILGLVLDCLSVRVEVPDRGAQWQVISIQAADSGGNG